MVRPPCRTLAMVVSRRVLRFVIAATVAGATGHNAGARDSGPPPATELARTAEAHRTELINLRGRLIQAADEEAGIETELRRREADVAALRTATSAQAQALAADRTQIAELLAALVRVSLAPPEVMLLRPDAPLATLRGALLMRAAVPALRRRAEDLTATLDRMTDLQRSLEQQDRDLDATRAALVQQRQSLAILIERRETLLHETESARSPLSHNAEQLAAGAKDVHDLTEQLAVQRGAILGRRPPGASPDLARIETARADAEQEAARRRVAAAPRPGAEPPAAILHPEQEAAIATIPRLPVVGRITVRYGAPDRNGDISQGITIRASATAPVVAPLAGTVLFAGPFRDYGLILIVEHNGGYHSLIAGLGRIDAAVGRQLAPGEPIGLMGSPGDGQPELYFELRRNGQPVDPQHSIAATGGRG
ncbi:MAG: peptidoglycan DD-metalloendopeptidase family protein [Azospirillaceae bacterium]|nr:peptidoglycan DD-metalloendopeptidase family protein [Azospirillaceae bacterium]